MPRERLSQQDTRETSNQASDKKVDRFTKERQYISRPENEKFEVNSILDFIKTIKNTFFMSFEEIESNVVSKMNGIHF